MKRTIVHWLKFLKDGVKWGAKSLAQSRILEGADTAGNTSLESREHGAREWFFPSIFAYRLVSSVSSSWGSGALVLVDVDSGVRGTGGAFADVKEGLTESGRDISPSVPNAAGQDHFAFQIQHRGNRRPVGRHQSAPYEPRMKEKWQKNSQPVEDMNRQAGSGGGTRPATQKGTDEKGSDFTPERHQEVWQY
ncbi:hypothetical protein ACRALDRAFT_1067311 [Sodiomyces alcalophilus JCM 7366]|uniref:uncharacterized protein n=1 Tax=Sodiomyces alcalophilus JCM 7366 TaxID=591952 RepID=UPI0039B60742